MRLIVWKVTFRGMQF